MSNEYPEIENTYEEQSPPQRRKDDQPSYQRRKDDLISHQRRKDDLSSHQALVVMLKSFEKVLNLLKYTVIALFVAMAILYNIFTGDTTRDDYQILLLNDLLIKIEESQKETKIDSSQVLERIINVSHATKQCAACHNKNNEIKLFASWGFIDFKNYMRGIKRIPQNNIMPNYSPNELTDLDLEKIYEILKDK